MAITPASWASYNAGTIGSGSMNPSVSVSPPTGLASGDTWLIVVCDWNGGTDAYTAPSGFTKVPTTGTWDDASGNCGTVLFYKANCTGSETAVTVTETIASGGLFACGAWRHSGAATSTPFVDVTDGAGTAQYAGLAASYTVSTNAAHTPTQANEVVYFIANTGSGGEVSAGGMGWSTPAGWTKLGQADHDTAAKSGVNAGDPAALVVFYQVQGTATSVPITSTTCTPSGGAAFGGGVVGTLISFFAAAVASNPFPLAYNVLPWTQRGFAIYKM